jgi:hypothetical protein
MDTAAISAQQLHQQLEVAAAGCTPFDSARGEPIGSFAHQLIAVAIWMAKQDQCRGTV